MDEDGYLYAVDRAKEMLIVGGFKVFSRVAGVHPSGHRVSMASVKNSCSLFPSFTMSNLPF